MLQHVVRCENDKLIVDYNDGMYCMPVEITKEDLKIIMKEKSYNSLYAPKTLLIFEFLKREKEIFQ